MRVLAPTPQLGAGETATLVTTLAAGTYVLLCTVPHHYVRERMVATLTVS